MLLLLTAGDNTTAAAYTSLDRIKQATTAATDE
jgi:hypothetical protein